MCQFLQVEDRCGHCASADTPPKTARLWKLVTAPIAGVLREGAIAAELTGLMILMFLGSWRELKPDEDNERLKN